MSDRPCRFYWNGQCKHRSLFSCQKLKFVPGDGSNRV